MAGFWSQVGGMLVMRTAVQALVTLCLGMLAAPPAAAAQPPAKVPRIGILLPSTSAATSHLVEAFRQGLRELGYVEGENIAIEYRWAEGKWERLPDMAAELVRLKVRVIVVAATPAVQAAQQATRTIPIVMAVVVDPMATGFVASLARPGGNITGLSLMAPELVGKGLELLKEVVPKLTRVAVLWNSGNPGSAPQLREAEVAARALRVRLQPLDVRGPNDLDRAFAAMTGEQAGTLIVVAESMFFTYRTRVAELAAKSRLPAVYGLREHVEAGGLMSYSANAADMYRRSAGYVDKILKGAKPADLPVEQPTRFELVINMKTAKALGLTFPPSILVRADQVIQ